MNQDHEKINYVLNLQNFMHCIEVSTYFTTWNWKIEFISIFLIKKYSSRLLYLSVSFDWLLISNVLKLCLKILELSKFSIQYLKGLYIFIEVELEKTIKEKCSLWNQEPMIKMHVQVKDSSCMSCLLIKKLWLLSHDSKLR